MKPNGAIPSGEFLNRLAKAYDLMKYDVALLGKTEADVFAKADASPDIKRKTSDEASFTKVKVEGGKTVGFVRFPSMRSGEDIPSEKLMNRITAIIRRESKSVDLIVGLSDWGWVGEREYLATNPQYVPDLLLGSGLGSGVNGRVEAEDRCIWIRPYDKGRTVNEIQVKTWPDRSAHTAWEEPYNYTSLSTGLGDQYMDHPDVGAILH